MYFFYVNQGIGKCTRFLFIPCGINPYGRFYFYYEIFRCSMAIIQCITSIMFSNILYPTHYFYPIMKALLCINLIDMYIRMHCHYYNSKGILVKHPLFTCKHYCQTALVIDIYCMFPITLIGLDIIFPIANRHGGTGFVYLMTRGFVMHRVVLALHHLAQKYEGSVSHWLYLAKVMVIVVTIMGTAVAMLYLMTCSLDKKNAVCSADSWITKQEIDVETISEYMLVCLYIIVTYFSTSFQGIAPVAQANISRYLSALLIVIIITRFYMLSYISGSGVGMNDKLTEYRIRLKRFMAFVKMQNIKSELVKRICDDCQYNWERGGDMEIHISNKFNDTLVLDLCSYLFNKAAYFSTIFEDVDADFLRTFGTNFKLQHFKKDSVIIQANDIQRNLYFISKGRVKVTMANITVEMLCMGGMFGCFNKRGETRQTITALALVHVDLLVIDSSLFYELAEDDPNLHKIAKRASMLQYEFFESKVEQSEKISISAESLSKPTHHNRFSITSLYNYINNVVNQQSVWFIYMDYFIFVHLAPIFCIVYLLKFFILHDTLHTPLNNFETKFLIIFDCIFIPRIILEYFLQYIDTETGMPVRNPSKIRKRYIYSLNFWLDLFTALPMEYIFQIFISSEFIIRFSTGNRVFRFLFLVRYYYRQSSKLNISRHLRWTFLLYISTFQIMLMATMWRGLACGGFECLHTAHASHKASTSLSKDYFESLLIILTYTVNMFTATGLRLMPPRDVTKILLSTVMAICSLLTISLLLSGFVSILVVENYSISRYEREIDDLKIYLQDRELSPQLLRQIWSYLTQLWYRNQGEHMPDLVLSTPKYLREQLYQQMYGHHIRNNYLFINTHVDFIRQLMLHLKRTIYFPGCVIVEAGDLNECMYFIRKGQVKKYTKFAKNTHGEFTETQFEKPQFQSAFHDNDSVVFLAAGQSFGEAQGLFNIPHTSTYTALTNVELLALKQGDWNYLLRWFPASLDELNDRAKESGLTEKSESSPIKPTGIASMANIFNFNTVHASPNDY